MRHACRSAGWSARFLATALVWGAAAPAFAGLGDPAATIAARDRAALRADAVTRTVLPLYERHEMTTADGANIREFAARDGTVFAVGFDSLAMPDMKTLLGDHYDAYLAAARVHRGNHHVMSFESDGMVVTIVKQPRGFSGQALLPGLVPAGVDPQELRR